MANFEKRTGRLRTGDLFSTTQVTCDEIKAAHFALCCESVSGIVSV
jgi:hypothetical protein